MAPHYRMLKSRSQHNIHFLRWERRAKPDGTWAQVQICTIVPRSRYSPHQGPRECARRLAQRAAQQAKYNHVPYFA